MPQLSSLLILPVLGQLLAAPALAEPTTGYPAIAEIRSTVYFDPDAKYDGENRCTGTYIHPRLLLTAAHCVTRFNAARINGQVSRSKGASGRPILDQVAGTDEVHVSVPKGWRRAKVFPSKVHVSPFAMPIYRGNEMTFVSIEQDLAILEFATAVAPATREISERPPGFGLQVEFVGIGEREDVEAGTKHRGRNTVHQAGMGTIFTIGSAETCGENATEHTYDWATCPGDSGGPLFDLETRGIYGVASTTSMLTGAIERRTSRHIDLTSPDARNFIRQVLDSVKTP